MDLKKKQIKTLAVLDLYAKLTNALDKGEYVYSVFLDFAKAFDTVNHKILLKKLENYGIRRVANNWFESYLTNRYQTVKIPNTLSEKHLITCGVPQGSILGPILFLIYIIDIKNPSKVLDFYLFADDTSTLLTGKDMKDIEQTYNTELKGVVNWLQANKLTLNVDKSNLVLFRKGNQKNSTKIIVKIDKEQIKEKEYTKYLGLLIDNKLSWQHHVKYLNLKVAKGVGIIAKLQHFASKNTLRMLYFAFVQPHIDYGLLLWGNANKSITKVA